MRRRREEPRLDRRRALAGGLALLGGLVVPAGRARAGTLVRVSPSLGEDGEDRSLILLQLSGGNDGLSTVVPFGDDAYHRARRSIRIEADDVLRLDEYRGLHPALGGLRRVWDDGHLALVEGVGYPGPSRSHFKSLDVWHTADLEGRRAREGWIGRLCAAAWEGNTDPNLVVHVGSETPYSLYSTTHPPASFLTPHGYRWAGDDPQVRAYERAGGEEAPSQDSSSLEFLRGVLSDAQRSSQRVREATSGYRARVEYPRDPFADALHDVAAMIDAGVGTRVYSVALDGFDTHDDQRRRHDRLMERLDACLSAFLADLHASSRGSGAIVVAFSEFGRRVRENGSRGTDHGVAGPVLVAGEQVRGGLVGRHPSLEELDEGDLIHSVDFRSVYATVLERWFGVPPAAVLGADFPTLPLV